MPLQKTAFISYRRTDLPLALLVFKDLTQHGYDVFIDYEGIAAGDFEQNIVENIRSRAHFLVVLSPKALRRCNQPGDWLRREIETAMASRRNIVPLMFGDFTFSAAAVARSLTGDLALLPKYNGLPVPLAYFEAAMGRLRDAYLSKPLDTILHPVSAVARDAAVKQQAAAVAASQSVVAAPHEADAGKPRVGAVIAGQGAKGPEPAAAARSETVAPAPPAAAPSPNPSPPPAATPSKSPLTRAVATAVALLGLASLVYWIGHDRQEGTAVTTTTTSAAPAPAPLSTSDPKADYQHGEDAFYGNNGIAQSDTEAVKWYRRAADEGYAPAQWSLGFMLKGGRGGLPKSDKDAVVWYRKAADQGYAAAQLGLGFMYEKGRGGLPKSDDDAVAWYRKAAEQGSAEAQSNLGLMYTSGRGGLSQSDSDAVTWYRKAADQGNAGGQTGLGFMYENGRGGLPQSDQDAVAWYRKAADQGDAVGQYNLATMYEDGKGGLTPSNAEALAWYRKSAAQGDPDATRAVERLTAGK